MGVVVGVVGSVEFEGGCCFGVVVGDVGGG